MPTYRVDRLNKDFKRELSAILKSMKDTRLDDMLSVIRVEVTRDLSYAKVYISSIRGAAAAKEACVVLQSAQGHVKSQLAHALHIRKIPELTFVPDDSVDYYNRISGILEGIHHVKKS